MICAPVQCCCKGPWTIGPGETLPLILDWSRWLNSIGGYNMNVVSKASLTDIIASPQVAADPLKIRVIAGNGETPDPADNSDVASVVNLMPPAATSAMIEVAPDATIGAQYRFDICLTARDCDGRKATMCDCVMVVIQQC